MDWNKLCEMIEKGLYNKDVESMKMASGAVKAFMDAPLQSAQKKALGDDIAREVVQRIKASGLGVTTDLTQITLPNYNVYVTEKDVDDGYLDAFLTVPLAPTKNSWQIVDIDSGLTFRKVKEGERIEVYGISGTKETVYIDKFGGALGWTLEMIQDRELATMMQLANRFRNERLINRANVHYQLLVNSVGAQYNNVTAYANTGGTALQNDIATLNNGCYTLKNRCKNKGYSANIAGADLLLYANLAYAPRIEAAIAVTNAGLTASITMGQRVMHNIKRIYTLNDNFPFGQLPILILPKNKIQRADKMQPTRLTDSDILNLTYVEAVWERWGAVMGDTDQAQGFTLD